MKARIERIEMIKRNIDTAEKDTLNKNFYTIKSWRGKTLYKKIIQVDSDFLMFRIENSRTEIQQLSYIRSHSLPKDFFSDPESSVVQQAQEEILINMIQRKGRDLLEDLQQRKQDDACIITPDGYIVNGNRRTAALKYLGERFIDCVVLPEDVTPKDIYLLEQQLQVSVDFREDYHWINELSNIRKGIDDTSLELSEAEIAKNLRLGLKELKVKLNTLDLVDAFLNWKKIPGDYDYVKLDTAEEIFRQLEKAQKKYSKELDKQKALRNLIFTLIEEKPEKGRLYNYVTYVIRNFDSINNKMQKTVKSKNTEINTDKDDKLDDDVSLLDDFVPKESEDQISVFEDIDIVNETSNNLIEAIEDVKAENKERENTEAVYDSVSKALRELIGLSIEDDTAKIEGIRKKLDEIIIISNKLLKELE